jgi:hypothetical protein
MNFYIETATDKLCFHDVEFAPRTQNQIDRFINKVDALERYKENHPKLLQRKDPDPVKLAELAAREQAVAVEVVDKLVLRGQNPDKSQKQVVLATPTYLCSWDGLAPFVTTLIGTFPIGGITMMGWPQTDTQPDDPVPPTQAQIDAALAVAAAKQAAQEQWRVDAQVQIQLGIPAYQAWIALNPYPT